MVQEGVGMGGRRVIFKGLKKEAPSITYERGRRKLYFGYIKYRNFLIFLYF